MLLRERQIAREFSAVQADRRHWRRATEELIIQLYRKRARRWRWRWALGDVSAFSAPGLISRWSMIALARPGTGAVTIAVTILVFLELSLSSSLVAFAATAQARGVKQAGKDHDDAVGSAACCSLAWPVRSAAPARSCSCFSAAPRAQGMRCLLLGRPGRWLHRHPKTQCHHQIPAECHSRSHQPLSLPAPAAALEHHHRSWGCAPLVSTFSHYSLAHRYRRRRTLRAQPRADNDLVFLITV